MKCPKCDADNTDAARFCSSCATSLTSAEEAQPSITKTIETAREELTTGSTFASRYTIIQELGRGGMGVVYKAEDTKLKRKVALKFLPSEITHIPDVKERFMREAQAAAALDHPHICIVYEFDEAEEKTFISMAYMDVKIKNNKAELVGESIVVVDMSTGQARTIDSEELSNLSWNAAWSSDGQNLVVLNNVEDKPSEMFIVPSQGGTPNKVELTGGPTKSRRIITDWSPDGKHIAFEIRWGISEIFVMKNIIPKHSN